MYSPEIVNEIDSKIDLELDKINEAQTFLEKFEFQNNLIQLKLSTGQVKHKSDIYLDIKHFIHFYIKSLDERRNNYDELQIKKIYDYLKDLSSEEKIKLISYLIRQLKIHGYDELIERCELDLRKEKFQHYCKKFSVRHLLSIIYLATTYNVLTILISVIGIYIVGVLLLLPAPNWSPELVRIEYHQYTDFFLVNHLLNVGGSILDLSDDFKVVPLNTGGFFLCFLGKLACIILVVNILIKQFEERIKL
jgi:hypothetical protein